MKGKRVFVSGGNGVIGNEIVKKLHKLGATLFVGDIKPRPEDWPADIRYRQGDLNFISKEELMDFNPDIFFHLAATFERSKESYDFWYENFHHNITLSNYLMTLLKDSPELKRVVFASSYLIYNPDLYQFTEPQKEAVSLNENHPISPRNLTGMAKLAHEIELKFLNEFKRNQYSVCSARIFRGYGKNSRDIISRWVRSLINSEEIFLFRKEGMFDYIFAEDTAEGLIRLASSDYSGIINLGTGKSRKVEDVIFELKKHFPHARITEAESNIPFEASQADITKLNNVIHWLPENSLENGIQKIIEFERKRNGVYNNSEKESGHVLITSISKKVPLILAVKASAKKISNDIRVYGGDVDDQCIGKHFCDVFWHMPRINELSKEIIVQYCTQHQITSIIPTRDGELYFWACIKEFLSDNGISVLISKPDAVTNCIDKLQFSNICQSLKIPAIETSLNAQDINTNVFVVKERYGAGSLSLGINLTYEEALIHAEKLNEPIFQPFINGEEISADVFIQQNSKAKGTILRKRELVVNGESQITTIIHNSEWEKLFIDYASQLNLTGHIIFQAIISQEKLHIIECNCRFGGASTFSIKAGLDSFYWFLLEARKTNIDEYPLLKTCNNLRMVRHPNDSFFI